MDREFLCSAVVVEGGYGIAFALFSAAMAFTVPATSLRLAKSNLGFLDAMQPSAYGIYLLHYAFLIWMQYVVFDPPLPLWSRPRSCSPARCRGAGC